MRNALPALSIFLVFAAAGCIHYSFSGSSLPSHIRSVSIPLFDNQTSRMGLEEKLRESITRAFSANNGVQVLPDNGDAELNMKILSYESVPDEYDAAGTVKTYRVIIRAGVDFRDMKENKALFADTLVGTALYRHDTETEENGMSNALTRLSEIVINSTLSGW